ncbi:MAG: hypothetical protein RBG13Loki_2734 [Promethearchaeota archaeon CR_4]|nr:MAG: hypothetical protein RBG13Loki_2734 [Candidatus Lokiarchaeota archaeon CR_4]
MSFLAKWKYRHVFFTSLYMGGWMILLYVLWRLGWPGDVQGCVSSQSCFCEFVDLNTFWGQPFSSPTNFAYVVSGFAIILYYDYVRPSSANAGPSKDFDHLTPFSFLYALLTITIGIGSLYMHVSWRNWAGTFDVYAMNLYIVFLLLYLVTHAFHWSWGRFLVLYIPIEVVMFVIYQWGIVEDANLVFGVLTAAVIILEIVWQVVSRFHQTLARRDWRLLFVSIAFFLGAFGIWLLQKSEIWPCDPDSLLQPHGLWHIFTAAATFTIFLYLKSEYLLESPTQKG